MKHYLLSVYQPDGDPPPSVDLDRIVRDVAALNEEMKAAGVWVFSDGLHPPSTATVVRMQGPRCARDRTRVSRGVRSRRGRPGPRLR